MISRQEHVSKATQAALLQVRPDYEKTFDEVHYYAVKLLMLTMGYPLEMLGVTAFGNGQLGEEYGKSRTAPTWAPKWLYYDYAPEWSLRRGSGRTNSGRTNAENFDSVLQFRDHDRALLVWGIILDKLVGAHAYGRQLCFAPARKLAWLMALESLSRPGDLICMIRGHRRPIILRPKQTFSGRKNCANNYRFVGETHGTARVVQADPTVSAASLSHKDIQGSIERRDLYETEFLAADRAKDVCIVCYSLTTGICIAFNNSIYEAPCETILLARQNMACTAHLVN